MQSSMQTRAMADWQGSRSWAISMAEKYFPERAPIKITGYGYPAENRHFNGSSPGEEDESLSTKSQRWQALMSFTTLPLRRTLRDNAQQAVGEAEGR
ncbi:hypothetical protein KM043_016864 [Ampulex compressa]|nr:hypothetical protein KM043_016864 [Ampulex compressa]